MARWTLKRETICDYLIQLLRHVFSDKFFLLILTVSRIIELVIHH